MFKTLCEIVIKKLFITLLCLLPFKVHAQTEEKPHVITIEIKVSCPMSPELDAFVKSIPKAGNYSSSYEEWESSFSNNMHQLLKLIESKKVYHSYWSVKTDDALEAGH